MEDYLERVIEAHETAAHRNGALHDQASFWFQKSLAALSVSIGALLAAVVGMAGGSRTGIAAALAALAAGTFVTFKEYGG